MIKIMKMTMIQMGTKMMGHLIKKISIVMKSMKRMIGNKNLKASIYQQKRMEENLNLANIQKIKDLTELII